MKILLENRHADAQNKREHSCSLAVRNRHGGIVKTRGMPLRMVQRMETFRLPEKYFSLDFLCYNFPGFKYRVNRVHRRNRDKKKLIAIAEKACKRHISLLKLPVDLDFQATILPDFKKK